MPPFLVLLFLIHFYDRIPWWFISFVQSTDIASNEKIYIDIKQLDKETELPTPDGDPPQAKFELAVDNDSCYEYALPDGQDEAFIHDYEVVYYKIGEGG